jgi:L-fuconolactonase
MTTHVNIRSLPIIDPHQHLWFWPSERLAQMPPSDDPMWLAVNKMARYLFDELLADLTTGHNVSATVFVESETMYRANGPESMKSIGEVEFVTGVAAMAAGGTFGTETRIATGMRVAENLDRLFTGKPLGDLVVCMRSEEP